MSRNYKPWAPWELTQLRRMVEAGKLYADIAAHFGRTRDSVRNKADELGVGTVRTAREQTEPPMIRPVAEYRTPDGPTLVEVLAPMASADEPEADFLQRMHGVAARSVAKASAQRHARLRIASDVPVGITLLSDLHAELEGTDLPAAWEFGGFVADTPGLYCLGMGDLLNNNIKHRGNNVDSVPDAVRWLDLFVARMRGKFLGTTSGNHDDWSKVFAGVDHLAALARRHRIHYAPDELLWVVEIVNPHDADDVTATYRIHTRHQWSRGSRLNPCHACWTWQQEEGPNWDAHPDVLAIGHNHVAMVESRQFEARDMWAIRPGSFQRDSSFARAKGFARYRATTPTIVLPPTRADRVQCFADPHDAVQYMAGASRAAA